MAVFVGRIAMAERCDGSILVQRKSCWTTTLADPSDPRLAGYLAVPGYSDYMQLIDADHLLTVGRNTPDGRNGPAQVSLFDISNMSRPLLVDKVFPVELARILFSRAHVVVTGISDPGVDAVTITASLGTITQIDTAGTWSWVAYCTKPPVDSASGRSRFKQNRVETVNEFIETLGEDLTPKSVVFVCQLQNP